MALQFVYDLELRRYRDAVLAKWHTFYAGVLNGTSLHIHELVATDMYDQAIRYVQELSLQEEIISWKSYRTGAWDYLLLASRNLVRVYVQLGTYYEPLQDLLPAAGMTHFEGIVPVNIPQYQSKFLLLAGSGSQTVAYAFKGPSTQEAKCMLLYDNS
ncbi:hypothetical protein C7M84_004737 [Penaeus vannamei]|uniref:Uncharacterized protein n=1 Tax=Penaeus vannamei TaxID=6689 RepID=A0A423TJQ5_PENVA|nr:hypothetical protein C7M84_004737 [Penaeus vannamei]